jgi:hypothetical protein
VKRKFRLKNLENDFDSNCEDFQIFSLGSSTTTATSFISNPISFSASPALSISLLQTHISPRGILN